jgi:hypothetical protein
MLTKSHLFLKFEIIYIHTSSMNYTPKLKVSQNLNLKLVELSESETASLATWWRLA